MTEEEAGRETESTPLPPSPRMSSREEETLAEPVAEAEAEAPASTSKPNTMQKKLGNRMAGLKSKVKPPSVDSIRAQCVDEENGLYLGRTPMSWAMILIFYLVYYILLAVIFRLAVGLGTNSLTSNNFKSSTGDLVFKPKIRTRVDQPGLAVFPHNNIEERGSEGILNFNSEDDICIREITQILWHRIIHPNLQTCPKHSPIMRYSEWPLKTHGTRDSLIRRQYGDERKRPLVILKLNRIIDWTPKPVKRADGDLGKNIEEFHGGNIYFTCKGMETLNEKGQVREDPNFKTMTFLNPNITGDANGCDKAGEKVGCLPVSWFQPYEGNDPFLEPVESRKDDEDSDPCDEGAETESDHCLLAERDRLDQGYKKNLREKGIIPKIVKRSCWPFMIGIVHAHDISQPVRVQCKAWTGNTNSLDGLSADDISNNVETTFGFRDLSSCDPDEEDCSNGGWY